jgi:hypothetical protein
MRPTQHQSRYQHHDQADRRDAGDLPSVAFGIAWYQQPAMQPADGGEELLAARRAQHMRIIGIDNYRGWPRSATPRRKADADRGRAVAR